MTAVSPKGCPPCLEIALEFNRSAHRLGQVGRSLAPEDGVNGQMSWRDVAFDADLVANVLGDLARAPALHAGDVELGKSANGHRAMIAAENRTG